MTHAPAWRQTISIRDETPGRLSFTLFAENGRKDWLPGQSLQFGHSFLARGLKVGHSTVQINDPS